MRSAIAAAAALCRDGHHVDGVLAQHGARVVIADIDDAQGKAAAKRIGAMARFERLDVRSEADWLALVKSVERRHRRIDVLVNNAGIYLSSPLPRLRSRSSKTSSQ